MHSSQDGSDIVADREALCGIIGFAELYHATGEADLSTAYQQIWWSLCQYERHNQGGMMSGEQARGDPYNTLSEETCCTVTWGAMCVEMLKLTGNSVVADELELSCLNSGLFLLSPSGRWCVYNSMMDGTRSSTMMEISFQCKPASSELSCCSVNGPRMMGLVAEYAVMRLDPGSKSTGYAVNLYSPGSVTVSYPKGDGHVVLTQKTTYPLDSKVELTVEPSSGSPTFTLWLRIPAWSEKTTVAVNGTQSSGVTAGKYFAINRAWKSGDKIDIVFDCECSCSLCAFFPSSQTLLWTVRLRAWVQPFGPSSSPSDSELEQPPGNFCVPCTTVADAPKPLWSSAQAGWPLNGKAFSGITQTAVGSTTKAFGSGPTTMMGWISSAGGEGVPFSIGAKMGTGGGSGDCRALDVLPGNANYYMRTTPYDSVNIISTASEQAKWSAAMKDGHYHHVAVADTGSQFTLYLDGVALSSGKHAKKPNTVGGFVVGGWADENRRFTGALAGVQFFGSSLAASDISAAMKATAPPQPDKPPRPPQLVKGCLYRGPLLLGFDPCFNPTVDTMPALNLEDLTFEQVTEESWLPPTLLLEFTAADKKTKVRLANYVSAAAPFVSSFEEAQKSGCTGLARAPWPGFPDVVASGQPCHRHHAQEHPPCSVQQGEPDPHFLRRERQAASATTLARGGRHRGGGRAHGPGDQGGGRSTDEAAWRRRPAEPEGADCGGHAHRPAALNAGRARREAAVHGR